MATFWGLLPDCCGRNCWTIAERAGDATPDGMQPLLAGVVWDHDGVRDDADYLVDHLGNPGAVLVVDETGDSRRAPARSGCGASTPGPPARSKTSRSPSTWRTPPRPGRGDRPELYLSKGWLADYVCAGPASLPLVGLVQVAGCRWRVEEAFQAGKGLCGLDRH